MVEDITGDLVCPTHGWFRHAAVHEAGHAVAAIDRDIAFTTVTVLPPSAWESSHDGTQAGGVAPRIENVHDLIEVVGPTRMFDFALAGCAAEEATWKHALEGSFVGDVNFWRRGIRLTGAQTPEDYETILGRALVDAFSLVRSWATTRRREIVDVAQALLSLAHADPRSPAWSLTEADVRAILASH